MSWIDILNSGQAVAHQRLHRDGARRCPLPLWELGHGFNPSSPSPPPGCRPSLPSRHSARAEPRARDPPRTCSSVASASRTSLLTLEDTGTGGRDAAQARAVGDAVRHGGALGTVAQCHGDSGQHAVAAAAAGREKRR